MGVKRGTDLKDMRKETMWQPREKPFQEGAVSTREMGVCLGCFWNSEEAGTAEWSRVEGRSRLCRTSQVMLRILSFTLNSLPLIFVGSMERMKMEAQIPCL